MQPWHEYVGWFAMTIFTMSFFFKSERATLYFQLGGGLAWLSYGVLIDKMPVVLANVLVAVGAGFKLVRLWRGGGGRA